MIEITQVHASLDEAGDEAACLAIGRRAVKTNPAMRGFPRLKPLSSIASQSTPVKSEMSILF